MRFRASWLVFNQSWTPEHHEMDIENERNLQQFLDTVKESPAEDVNIYPVGTDGNKVDGSDRMQFQLNEDKTLAYVVCGLQESVGQPDSAEIFTTSGGSFSSGTGIPVVIFEDVIAEFVRTGKQPSIIQWRNEIDDFDAPLTKDDDLPL